MIVEHEQFDIYRDPREFVRTEEDSKIRQAMKGLIQTVLESTQTPVFYYGIRDVQLCTATALSTTVEVIYSGRILGVIDRVEYQYICSDIMGEFGFEAEKFMEVEDITVSPLQPGLMREIWIWPSITHKGLGFVRKRQHFKNNEREDKTTEIEWSAVDLRRYPNATAAYAHQRDLPSPYSFVN